MSHKWLEVLGVKGCFEVEENSHYRRQFVQTTLGVLSLGLYGGESAKDPTPSKNSVGHRWTRSILVVTEASIRTFSRTKRPFTRGPFAGSGISDEYDLLGLAGSVELVIPFEDIVSFTSNREHVVEIATLHISGSERYHYIKCRDFVEFDRLVHTVEQAIEAHKRIRLNSPELPPCTTEAPDRPVDVLMQITDRKCQMRYEAALGQSKVIAHVSRFAKITLYLRTCRTDVYETTFSLKRLGDEEESILPRARLLFATAQTPGHEIELDVLVKLRKRPYRDRIWLVYGAAIAASSVVMSTAAYSPYPFFITFFGLVFVALAWALEVSNFRRFDLAVCVEKISAVKTHRAESFSVVKSVEEDADEAAQEQSEENATSGGEALLKALAPATSHCVPSRWLEATNGDAILARSKWEKSLEWRKQLGVDEILNEPQPYFRMIKDNSTYAWTGVDNEGNLVAVQDLSKVAQSVQRMKELGK